MFLQNELQTTLVERGPRILAALMLVVASVITPWMAGAIYYDVCRGAIVDAHKRHVMVVGYGMALPYLLTLYQLHLQFARTVDMEKMQSALIDVERHLDVLENKLQRAVTMLQNAYGEGKQVSARIRASAQSIQVAETVVEELSTEPFSLALVDQLK